MDVKQISDMVRRVMNENAERDAQPSEERTDVSDTYSDIRDIPLKIANELIAEVIKRAAEMDVAAVCAVVNSGANPVSVQSADGAYIASYDIALGKAYTSASLKMKTSVLKTLAAPGGSLHGIQHTNGGKIVIFGGGIPLAVGDRTIGGFGVSGGSEEQDSYLGEYAEEVFLRLAEKYGLQCGGIG